MPEVKIIGNIETSDIINRFDLNDLNLIPTYINKGDFIPNTDFIELYIYDIGNNILNIDNNYLNYKLSEESYLTKEGGLPSIQIDPINDIRSYGYYSGEYKIQYNFFRKKIENLFIKEISSDRTEIAVSSLVLNNQQIEELTNNLLNEINNSEFFKTYLINFGVNRQELVINIALNKNIDSYDILLKLYKPLPEDIDLKTTLDLVDELVNPYIFDINLNEILIPDPLPKLSGPNFDIPIDNTNTISTQYLNKQNLKGNYNSYYQLLSFTTSQSIDINVDYSYPINYSKFGSLKNRIENFYNKVKNIEEYNNLIDYYIPYVNTTSSLSLEISKISSSISDIISHFDGLEYYLYFESASFNDINRISPFPKINWDKPYKLYNTGSLQALNWYNNSLYISENYDTNNLDMLFYTIPDYIREENINNPYFKFMNMIGHYFDNIWIYIKSISDVWKSYNNLEDGISKDLVYYSLQSLGLKTYNSKENVDLDEYLIGYNSGSNEFIDDFSYTSSFLNNIPQQDLLAESFKRLYHNISLLFKSKGTKNGYELLNNIYGITGSILEIKEFGGINKDEYLIGYSKSKSNVIENNIEGNVLSYFKSLNNNSSSLSIDNHIIDISFSPQNQIDKVISSSINNNYSDFNIDNYIGDPREAYDDNYINLKTTSSLLFNNEFDYTFDYNGFIRLIRYFDNSLFKTLKNFTPARNNITTGVTFRSPQLERNKVPQTKTTIDYITVLTGSICNVSMSEDNSYIYKSIKGDRSGFYTGDIEGNYPKINIDYYNPYILQNLYVQLPSIQGGNLYNFYDKYIFDNTDYNILLNNIYENRLSTNKRKLEPVYHNNIIIGYSSSYYAQLQDTYENLRSYNTSRYEGIKLLGKEYNKFTTGSFDSDISYGKEPVINRNSWKFAWIKSVSPKNINFYNKTTLSLRYLVNKEGLLTNLSRENRNLFEIQNIFKQGTSASVALLNPIEPTNQVALNGLKPIWEGGFSYSPIIYRETNESLYFNYLNPTNVVEQPLGIKVIQKDTISWTTSGNADRSFNHVLVSPNEFRLNGAIQSVPLSLTWGLSTSWPYNPPIPLSFTGNYKIWNGSYNTFTSNVETSNNNRWFSLDYFLMNDSGSNGGYATIDFSGSILTEDSGEKYIYFKAPRQSQYVINLEIPIEIGAESNPDPGWSIFKIIGLVEKRNTSTGNWQIIYTTKLKPIHIPSEVTIFPPSAPPPAGTANGVDENNSAIVIDGIHNSNFIVNAYLYNQSISLNTNDEIRIRLMFAESRQFFMRSENITFKIPATGYQRASLEIYDSIGSLTSLILSGSIESNPPIFNFDSSSQYITFNQSASLFYNNTIFVGSNSNISSSYSPVIYPFSFEIGDIIRFGTFFNDSAKYYSIVDIKDPILNISGSNMVVNSPLRIKLDQLINSNEVKTTAFAILRKSPDETCVILDYNKPEGVTTQGTLASEDLKESITEEIANIIGPIKTQLISDI